LQSPERTNPTNFYRREREIGLSWTLGLDEIKKEGGGKREGNKERDKSAVIGVFFEGSQ